MKVLDFGLAKAFQPNASDPGLSASPTISLTAAATQMRMVIGTALLTSKWVEVQVGATRSYAIWAVTA